MMKMLMHDEFGGSGSAILYSDRCDDSDTLLWLGYLYVVVFK